MNFDFSKITFNELDTEYPIEAFFGCDFSKEEIDVFLSEYATCREIPEGVSIQDVEFCLTMFARYDFKLEAVCTSDDGNQYWITVIFSLSNADEWIALMPTEEKLFMERAYQRKSKHEK